MKPALILVAVVAGCGGGASAKDLCAELERQGLGTCAKKTPAGFTAAAEEVYHLELKQPEGSGCFVMSFKSDAGYDSAVKGYKRIKDDTGPHQYGNPKRRLFAQCSDMNDDDATTLRATIATF